MKKVTISLSEDEALVLFEFLSRLIEDDALPFEDQAEQRAVWDLQASLEREVAVLFDPRYAEHLARARDTVRDDE